VKRKRGCALAIGPSPAVATDRPCLWRESAPAELSLRREGKFWAFGWNVVRIDGHDLEQIVEALDAVPDRPRATPTIIIADTVKGKGVSYMEGTAEWHGGAPMDEQLAQALAELGGKQ